MKDIYAPLLRNWIFPLAQKLRGRDFRSALRSGYRNQGLDHESLRELQYKKLQAILGHAYTTVPYYRNSFNQAGFNPKDIQSLEDLDKIPVLTKSEILENPELFISSHPRTKAQTFTTSGSTGTPLSYHQDQGSITASLMSRTRALEAWGVKLGERHFQLWSTGTDVRFFTNPRRARINHLILSLEDRLMNRRSLSPFEMTSADRERYWRLIESFHPVYIIGYPSAIEYLAQFMSEQDQQAESAGVRLVVSIGEILYDEQRELIGKVFGCPVVDEYGSAEAGVIAYRYPCGEIHAMDDSLIVEVQPANPGDEIGEVIITHLENFASPLIRYNIQDLALTWDGDAACPLGIGFSRLQKIIGREFDMMRLPNGQVVHGVLFNIMMRKIAGVRKFQVIQKSSGTFVFNVVLSTDTSLESVENEIKARMSNRFGIMDVEVNSMPEIPPQNSGKFRYVISEMN